MAARPFIGLERSCVMSQTLQTGGGRNAGPLGRENHMPSLTSLVVLAAGLCGAAWGWRVGTKRLYRRSVFRDDDDDRGARGWRRRLRQRYFTTVGCALLSALTVLIVMTTFRR
jgi:hypothetical protein